MNCIDCGESISRKAVRCRPCADIAKRLVIDDAWLERNTVRNKDGCLIWQGCTNAAGYGTVTSSNQWSEQLVHRLVYLWKVGPITAATLDHSCYNRRCCEVTHLTQMSRRDNSKLSRRVLDQISRVRCPHGHPYSAINTYVGKDGRRHCRACIKYYNAVQYAKKTGRNPASVRREDFVVRGGPEAPTV